MKTIHNGGLVSLIRKYLVIGVMNEKRKSYFNKCENTARL